MSIMDYESIFERSKMIKANQGLKEQTSSWKLKTLMIWNILLNIFYMCIINNNTNDFSFQFWLKSSHKISTNYSTNVPSTEYY